MELTTIPNRAQLFSDGTTWTTIFSHDNPNRSIWSERLQVIRFNHGADYDEQTEAYSMFRMVTDATGATAGSFFQLGEIEFFDADFTPPPPSVRRPCRRAFELLAFGRTSGGSRGRLPRLSQHRC